MIAKIVDFKSEHLQKLLEEDSVAFLRPHLTPEITKQIEDNPLAKSIELNGEIVFSGGISMYWPGRGEAWAFFSESAKKNFVPVFRTVKKWLDDCPVTRVEAAVDVGFEPAHRWVQLLGFKMECPLMRSFRQDGGDCALYARVK